MLQQHRSLLLHQLGISHWIRRDAEIHAIEHYSLWRDDELPDVVPQSQAWQNDMANLSIMPSVLESNDVAIDSMSPVEDVLLEDQTLTDLLQSTPQHTAILPETLPNFNQQVQFEFCMCRQEKWIALTAIHSPEQQQLWLNLLQAIQAKNERVQWPPQLEWAVYDDLIPYYLKGLFLAKSPDRLPVLLCLGESSVPMAYLQRLDLTMIQLPSLQACLENPMEKQQLWQRVYQANYIDATQLTSNQ